MACNRGNYYYSAPNVLWSWLLLFTQSGSVVLCPASNKKLALDARADPMLFQKLFAGCMVWPMDAVKLAGCNHLLVAHPSHL